MSEETNQQPRQVGEPRTKADTSAQAPSPREAVPALPAHEPIPEANAYVVEVDGQTVGIVARDESGSYRFHASINRFNALEGRSFKSPREAERAAHQLTRSRFKKPRPFVPRARLALVLT